jgi:putative nucleotidyltransferase with HDIG domain
MANGKNTSRRREVRRAVPRPGPAWLSTLRQPDALWAALFVLTFTVVGGAVIVYMGQQPRHFIGEVLAEPVVARVAFEHRDVQATEQARIRAREEHPAVYVANQAYITQLERQLSSLIALADYERLDQVPEDYREQVGLTQGALNELRGYFQGGKQVEQWEADVAAFIQRLLGIGVLRPERFNEDRFRGIQVNNPAPLPTRSRRQTLGQNHLFRLLTPDMPDSQRAFERDLLQTRLMVAAEEANLPPEIRRIVVATVMGNLQPTYIYDPELTQQARLAAYEATEPVTTVYKPRQELLGIGHQITAADLELIEEEHRAFLAQRRWQDRLMHHLGVFGLVLLVGGGLWGYIFAYNPRIARNPMRGVALTALLLLCQFVAVGLTHWHPAILFATATFPTLFAAVVLSIVYDQRFALAIGAFHTVLVMLSLELPIEFGIVLLSGIGVAVSLLREVRTRSKLVLVGGWAGLAMGGTTLLTSIATRDLFLPGEITRILTQDTLYAILTGVGVGLLVQGMLPFIERVFKVTTAMTLKELNDASHPLLQRLAQEAAGTYQHSLRIADMAEAAAEAIDADGLLCRVGAMYHDVGKINKPQYFIENQGGGPNRHTKLSPAMSLLIIVGHVKDGVEMAREYGLPPVIRHFIESHHGTTLVEYFYHAARKQKEAADQDAPSEFEFRYPGPKPQSKEAAIMLLCDSIEAAARSLAEPTPIRLEQLVHAMASKRLMDGQFDECNLTLQDLHKIEQAITKTLCAVYHSRIKYPGGGERRDERREEEPRPAAEAPAA